MKFSDLNANSLRLQRDEKCQIKNTRQLSSSLKGPSRKGLLFILIWPLSCYLTIIMPVIHDSLQVIFS